MKKYFIVMLIAIALTLSSVTANAGWRHLMYRDYLTGALYLIHPSGAHWYLVMTKNGRLAFKKG